jgi:Domain of unknown function (DUF4942)
MPGSSGPGFTFHTMFNKDFYPTPHSVLDQLGIECAGKVVLEPSAGKGNIIEWLSSNGAAKVLACEINPDLATIARSKADQFIGADFMQVTAEQISHIDMIVMNPPFSADEKHIIHAFKIAPGGCTIHALCNWQTWNNRYNRHRDEFGSLINNYGNVSNLGNAFADAERQTGVEVGYVVLHKPGAKPGMDEFEGFFMEEEPEELPNGPGIMRFNAIRDIVQRYVHSCRKYAEFEKVAVAMNQLTRPFDVGNFSFTIRSNRSSSDGEVLSNEQFRIELQKAAWRHLFATMNMDKYVTKGVRDKINAFAESQQKVPFTERNIYRMFEIIVATSEQNFNEALVSAVDEWTKHTHDNRFGVEGWKTNTGHMLNKRFIVDHGFRKGWGGQPDLGYGVSNWSYGRFEDLVKVLCHLTATPIDTIPSLYDCLKGATFGQWFEWGFFRMRVYMKGTAHVEFLNLDHWALLNQRYATLKGVVLPDKTWQRPKRKKQTA